MKKQFVITSLAAAIAIVASSTAFAGGPKFNVPHYKPPHISYKPHFKPPHLGYKPIVHPKFNISNTKFTAKLTANQSLKNVNNINVSGGGNNGLLLVGVVGVAAFAGNGQHSAPACDRWIPDGLNGLICDDGREVAPVIYTPRPVYKASCPDWMRDRVDGKCRRK